ncbi:hypothetical protein ACN4GA_08310 [Raoultella terrigena]
MYHLDNTSGVPEMPEPKEEQSISPRWFGESQEQGGISWPGADWFNTVQAELLNLLTAAGIQPEKKSFDQLSRAIPVLGSEKIKNDLILSNGFSLIGQVPSYSVLKQVVPDASGVHILLAHYHEGWAALNTPPNDSGEYISRTGIATDDGGHICVPEGQSQFYWERVTNVVNLLDYGVYLQGITTSRSVGAVDMAPRVQAAINRAVLKDLPLVSTFPMGRNPSFFTNGVLLRSSIDITNLRVMAGDYPFFANNLTGQYTNDKGMSTAMARSEPYVIFNKNASFDERGYKYYGSNYGGQYVGKLALRNVGDRSTHLNGQIHLQAQGTFDVLRAVNFHGTAINMGSSYDYHMREIGSEQSGGLDYFAVDCQSYPAADKYDEHNAYSIDGVIVHDCYDRSARISGSKGYIGRIHDENLRVTAQTPFKGYSFAFDSTNRFGYTNCFYGGSASTIGAHSVHAFSGNEFEVVAVCALFGTKFDDIFTTGAVSVSTVSGIVAANMIGCIRIQNGDLYIGDQSRLYVGSVSISSGDVMLSDTRSSIGNLMLSGNITQLYGRVERLIQTGNMILHPKGDVQYAEINGNVALHQGWAGDSYLRNTAITGNVSVINAAGNRSYIENLVIGGDFTTSSNAVVKAKDILVNNNLSIIGTSLDVSISDSRFKDITFQPGASGNWFFGIGCSLSGTLTNWTLPNGSAPRQGSVTVNPATGAAYLFRGTTWRNWISAPST